MLRVHHRFFAGFLGVIGLLVSLVVVFVGSGVRDDLTTVFREDLGRQLAVGEWVANSFSVGSADQLARQLTDRIGWRVSIISEAGDVLGDSYVASDQIPAVENHADRPEVVGALAGGDAFATRASATVGTPLLYGARRVDFDGQSVVLRIAASLEEVELSVGRVRRRVAATGLLATLVAMLVAYGLSVALTRPLVHLAEQARRMGDGDFAQRAARQTGAKEVDDVAGAFNRLAGELQTHVSDLERQRDEMQALIDCMEEGVIALTSDARVFRTNRAARDILGLREDHELAPIGSLVRQPALRDCLEGSVLEPSQDVEVQIGDRTVLVSSRSLDLGGAVSTLLDVSELRRLERVRQDFVANASHELRSPLTSIRGFAETLLDDDPPEPYRSDFLAAIRDNSVRLQRLVEDLLDLSRLESGGWIAKEESVGVASAIAEAWGPLARTAEEKKVEIEVEAPGSIAGDRQGLVQVFRNLLENALRHTEVGGRIHVHGEEAEGDRVIIAVSDDGEGIPSHALPRVFERFYRADSSRARDAGGTGLGLAIVRHLVQAMGGEVVAESKLGQGTTVRLTLKRG